MNKISNKLKVLPVYLLVAAVATPALAQDNGIRYGAQASFVHSGDSALSSGLGLGVIGEMSLSKESAIRVTIDWAGSNSKKETAMGNSQWLECKYNSIGIIGDFLYSFDTLEKGLFFFGGIGYVATKIDGLSGDSISSKKFNPSANGIVITAGTGYSLTRNLSAELRYIKPTSDPDAAGAARVQLSWIKASITYRF